MTGIHQISDDTSLEGFWLIRPAALHPLLHRPCSITSLQSQSVGTDALFYMPTPIPRSGKHMQHQDAWLARPRCSGQFLVDLPILQL